MRLRAFALAGIFTTMLIAPAAHAQGPAVQPAQGQTAEQISKDRGECHTLAVQQSGFDPAKAQAAAPQPPPQQGGERARGAARGAAAGAVIGGASGGDAGQGAAAGAAAGTAAAGSRQRREGRQQQAQAQQQQQAVAQSQAGYNQALGGCLQSRGYVVK